MSFVTLKQVDSTYNVETVSFVMWNLEPGRYYHDLYSAEEGAALVSFTNGHSLIIPYSDAKTLFEAMKAHNNYKARSHLQPVQQPIQSNVNIKEEDRVKNIRDIYEKPVF